MVLREKKRDSNPNKNKKTYLGVGFANLLWRNYTTYETFYQFEHLWP